MRVQGANAWDWNRTQPYTVTYRVCNQPDEAADYFDGAEKIDPSISEIGYSTIHYGYLCPDGDEDWYKFAVPSAYPVTITVDLEDLPADYDLDLYTPSGTLQKQSQNPGTASEKITHYVNSVGGEWHVRVYSGVPGASSATQDYELEVDLSGMLRDLAFELCALQIQKAEAGPPAERGDQAS